MPNPVTYIVRYLGYARDSARRTSSKLKFDKDGTLLNPRSLAMSRMVGWGEVQTSKKMRSKFGHVWWVTTPGHGGAILVTQTLHPELKDIEPAHKIENSVVKVYVYEFEEDCDWAVLCYLDETFMKSMNDDRNSWPRVIEYNDQHTLERFKNEDVIPTMKEWHPELLKEEVK